MLTQSTDINTDTDTYADADDLIPHSQGRVTGLELESKHKAFDAALKDYNRAQAHVPTLSDEFNQSQADAEALKLGVQEKVRLLSSEGLGHQANGNGIVTSFTALGICPKYQRL